MVDKVNDIAEMKNTTNSLESKLTFENKYILYSIQIIFYELIVKTALKEEIFEDRNFYSFTVFESFGESLCLRKFQNWSSTKVSVRKIKKKSIIHIIKKIKWTSNKIRCLQNIREFFKFSNFSSYVKIEN